MTRTGRVSGYGVGMTDRKGVDSIRRGGRSDGKRGGAELRREGAASLRGSRVVGLRTDAGRERRRRQDGAGNRVDAATAARKVWQSCGS